MAEGGRKPTLTLGKIADNGVAVCSVAVEVALVATTRVTLTAVADVAVEVARVAVRVPIHADLQVTPV